MTTAPLLTPRGMLIALVAAMLLAWPMLATGSYLIFADTPSYIRGGDIIGRMVLDMLDSISFWPTGGMDASAVPDAGTPAPPAEDMRNERGEAYVVRSFIYSLYTLVTGASVWPAGFAILQAAMTLWTLFALIGPAAASRPWVLGAGFLAVAALTTLPWFTVYLMPDLMAAIVLIYGAILMRRFDDLRPWQRFALGAIACLAVAAHYGHGPLALGLFGLVLLWRLIARRLTWAVLVAGIVPVMFAPLANLGASSVALDTPSVAPLRLPILLARSIQDGPARWYLQEVCPEAPLAFCEAFGDDVPTNIPQFLWDENGIDSLSPELMAQIRAEEFRVLALAFRAYPVQQTVSLFRNAALQTVKIGTEQIEVASWSRENGWEPSTDPYARTVLERFDTIVLYATGAAGVLLVLLLLAGRLTRTEREVLAVLVLGHLLNALIFGGLSAPVDRYQSRIAWLFPAFAVIVLARMRSRTADVAIK
ncbi:hypothetical protein [Paracoccus sediminilitoris]|uniref:hypothetical protein n=1 Tax=Paracoccus sediminilitoris TaxID=2202419 RepID=UPI000DBA8DB9|nr:hypothetical protein [Paracoccus sediminilitoris]